VKAPQSLKSSPSLSALANDPNNSASANHFFSLLENAFGRKKTVGEAGISSSTASTPTKATSSVNLERVMPQENSTIDSVLIQHDTNTNTNTNNDSIIEITKDRSVPNQTVEDQYMEDMENLLLSRWTAIKTKLVANECDSYNVYFKGDVVLQSAQIVVYSSSTTSGSSSISFDDRVSEAGYMSRSTEELASAGGSSRRSNARKPKKQRESKTV
jgi:hypothetical protein